MDEIRVGGQWLSALCSWRDLETTTVWPGGCGQATWTAPRMPSWLQVKGTKVEVYSGPSCYWAGLMAEPDAAGGQLTARGTWQRAGDFLALDGAGLATAVPDDAIDRAIADGLEWRRLHSISTTAVDIDLTQGPVKLGELLDAYALDAGERWGIMPDRRIVSQADPLAPSWHILGLDGNPGTADDTYASTLFGVYNNGAGFSVVSETDAHAEYRHDRVEAPVDLTPRGTLTAAKAHNILRKMLDQGRSAMQWRDQIEVARGDILTPGGQAAALNQIRAGDLLRVHAGFDTVNTLDGRVHLDVLIGETHLAGGHLTLTPLNAAPTTQADVIAAVLSKGAR